MAFCSNCGARLDDDAKFCPACGKPAAEQAENEAESRIDEDSVDLSAITISDAYKNAFDAFKRQPLPFIGVMLLGMLLSVLAAALGVIPIISIPLLFLLEIGGIHVCAIVYRGEKPVPEHLFVAFTKNALHFIGGMGWMTLWIILWGLIPVVGIVFAVMKYYSYRFTPYILLFEPEVSATDALRRSIALTEGLKGKMFGADMIVAGICIGASLIIAIMQAMVDLRVVVVLTSLISAALLSVAAVFAEMILGLVATDFYYKRTGRC